MKNHEIMPLGVVLEKRRTDHPWKDVDWRPVAVIPGAREMSPAGAWKLLRSGDGWDQYHCGTLPLQLFRRETEGYKVNLSQDQPRVFVVLRSDEEDGSDHEVLPFLVTVCPYEAQDYLDSGEEIVEGVPMPRELIAFVQLYVDQHHVDEPFKKRKRKPHDPRKSGFERPRPPSAGKGPRQGGLDDADG